MVINNLQKKIKVTLFLILFFFINCSLLFGEFGFRLIPNVSVPVGVEYFNTGFGAGISLDWAYPLTRKFSPGLSIMGSFTNFPMEYTPSFSFLNTGGGLFFQYRINDRFSVRADSVAGIYRYIWRDENNTRVFTGGSLSAQYHLNPFVSFVFETGYLHQYFSETRPIGNFKSGLGIQLNLSELLRPQSRLKSEKTQQYNVFPVNFAWYEDNPIATIQITNEEPNAITNVELSFLLERYMNQPSVFGFINYLAPGQTVEVPVTALFNESMLELYETVSASSQIITEYRSLGTRKSNSFHLQMPIFSRNSMTWDDDRRAASFVSPYDPAAVYFARYVDSSIGKAQYQNPHHNPPENVRTAAALFESLRLYGISYIVDSARPFVEMSANATQVDNIGFPYETLLYRGGECSDLAILYAAMLEVLGIETAFITIPGHIYIAFNIDDKTWRGGHADIIERGGKRWLPVEITVPDRGFSEACRIGARQWRNAGEEADFFPMHESWLLYPPVTVNAAGDNLPVMPERGSIVNVTEPELLKMKGGFPPVYNRSF